MLNNLSKRRRHLTNGFLQPIDIFTIFVSARKKMANGFEKLRTIPIYTFASINCAGHLKNGKKCLHLV